MTSPLPEIGEWLYGPHWEAPLARALEVNRRRVSYWTAGREEVPEGVWRELYQMLVERAHENARLSWLVMRELHPDEEHI